MFKRNFVIMLVLGGVMAGVFAGIYIANPSLLTRVAEPTSAESYIFTTFNKSSGEYTILKSDSYSHIKTKYIAECEYYKWGDREAVSGKDSRDIIVGRVITPNRFTLKKSDFVDVFYQNDTLYIIQGEGSEKITQAYKIKLASLIS